MSLNFEETNVLGNVLNQTWAKSSTAQSGSPQFSIAGKVVNDERMLIEYCTVVNFFGAEDMHSRAKSLEKDGMKLVEEWIKRVKREFKSDAGRALKMKILESHPSIEKISMSAYADKSVCYFRVSVIVEYS